MTERNAWADVLGPRKAVGIVASALAVFGLFAPAIVVPFGGAISLMGIHIIGGLILLTTLASAAAIATDEYEIVWITNGIATIATCYAYYGAFLSGGGSGFDAIIQGASQPSFAWGLLGVGLAGVFLAAANPPWDRDSSETDSHGDMRH